MKISLISTSLRKNSQSNRVKNIFSNLLDKKGNGFSLYNLDLLEINSPLWSSEKKNSFWENVWPNISKELDSSNGFIFFVPEYGGMASPLAKNFFLMCNKGELSHKPGLIVSLSSGEGGSYPVSELRSSSYKNTHLMWIPENIIIKNVNEFKPGSHGPKIPDWLDKRIDYSLNLLIAYSKNMVNLKKIINRQEFGNGM